MKNCTSKVKKGSFLIFTFYFLLFASSSANSAQQQKQPSPAAKQQSLRSIEEERLNILKADIQREMEKYRKLKKEIDEAQKALDVKNEEKLQKLAKMYEAMPSDEAARKLERLDDETAVTILGSLKPKTAGKILAQMENEKAATLSKRILSKGTIPRAKTSP
ncbi:MAG: hypothetical protein AB1553_08360 [Nitrospirota bacterium]